MRGPASDNPSMSLEPNHPDDAVTTSKQSPNLFPGVKVILVETTHPGNIGAAARAMKNMGLTELVLVNPLDYPNMKSIFRSASALDVVKGATVVQTVEEAVADCHLVIGTSARDRRIP
jgi:tRNA (cytidine32/uridine32-2'-O)-methyltransferase